MCTAMCLRSKKKDVYFGRTMDFSYVLDPEIYFVPKGSLWNSIFAKEAKVAQYNFLGTAQSIGDHLVFADGMNEKGLGVAVLYFPGYAKFDEMPVANKISLASLELVRFLLSFCASLDEVVAIMPKIQLVGIKDPITNSIAPLHWIVSDRSGKTITIEKMASGLAIYDNPVGVLANSPDLSYHLTNLRNYLAISPKQKEEEKWEQLYLTPFGQGAGGFGLPGDYSSPSRFVRVAFQKNYVELPDSKEEMMLTCFHIMKTVSIPKGVVVTKRGTSDYTQYTAFMNLHSGDYYVSSYYHPDLQRVNLFQIPSQQVISLGKIK